MSRQTTRTNRALIPVLFSSLLWLGCGGESTSTPESTAQQGASAPTESNDSQANQLPTASIGSNAEPLVQNEPAEGTPARLLEEIRSLRSAPISGSEEEVNLEKLREIRRNRNLKIIDLSTEVISKTHAITDQEEEFTTAVRQLLEARLQLAYQGNAEDIDALYADAELLRELEDHPTAAADATHALVMFANTNAGRFGSQEPRWLQEFARLATLFSTEFPADPRAVPALFAAAISCDLYKQSEEAIQCLEAIAAEYPDSAQAKQAVPILRRLQMTGKELEFAGPTLQGDFIKIDDYRGKFVLIVFWSSDNQMFQDMAPSTIQLAQKYSKYMETIGVCLDEDEVALNTYLEKTAVPWKNIFDPGNRRWDNRIVSYYGVRSIPTFWVVDHKGVVRIMTHEVADLDEKIKAAMLEVRDELQR